MRTPWPLLQALKARSLSETSRSRIRPMDARFHSNSRSSTSSSREQVNVYLSVDPVEARVRFFNSLPDF